MMKLNFTENTKILKIRCDYIYPTKVSSWCTGASISGYDLKNKIFCILDVNKDTWDNRKEMTYAEFVSEIL